MVAPISRSPTVPIFGNVNSVMIAATIFRWVLAAGLLYFWVMPLLCNLWGPISIVANRFRSVPLRHVSMAPIIGGIAGVLILLVAPFDFARKHEWMIVLALLPELAWIFSLLLGLLMCLVPKSPDRSDSGTSSL